MWLRLYRMKNHFSECNSRYNYFRERTYHWRHEWFARPTCVNRLEVCRDLWKVMRWMKDLELGLWMTCYRGWIDRGCGLRRRWPACIWRSCRWRYWWLLVRQADNQCEVPSCLCTSRHSPPRWRRTRTPTDVLNSCLSHIAAVWLQRRTTKSSAVAESLRDVSCHWIFQNVAS